MSLCSSCNTVRTITPRDEEVEEIEKRTPRPDRDRTPRTEASPEVTPDVTTNDAASEAPYTPPKIKSDGTQPTPTPAEAEPNMGKEYFVSPYHPIVCGDLLIGGSKDGKWLTAQEVAPHINGSELYTLFTMDDVIGNAGGGTIPPDDENYLGPYAEFIEDWELMLVPGNSFPEQSNTVYGVPDVDSFFTAVSADWDAMPRVAAKQALKNDTYEQIVKDVLAENGLVTDKVNILQHYRLDFEGDGVDEVVLYAESPTTDWRYGTENGSYSIMILRKIVNGKVQNIVLHIDIHTDVDAFYEENHYYPLRTVSDVCGFYDLNGDGILELLTRPSYYEGFYYNVLEITATGSVFAVGNGWGV